MTFSSCLFVAMIAMVVVLVYTDTNSIIFVAPPIQLTHYYDEFKPALYDYYANFIDIVNNNNNSNEYILAIVDRYAKNELLSRGVPSSNILENMSDEELKDIWIRDFGTVQVNDILYKFIFSPDYLTDIESKRINDAFIEWLEYYKINYVNISIVLDGGNFVFERNTNKLIMTNRVLIDNPEYTENGLINKIKQEMNVSKIAIIDEEALEATGHADGMVTFINDNIIGINNASYATEYDLYIKNKEILNAAFGKNNISIVDLPYDPTWEHYRQYFSAKGVYTNVLTGLYTQYSPIYSETNEDDTLNIDILNEYNSFNVNAVGVNATDVCILGGAVRCLTWYIWGKPADAFINAHNIVKPR